MATHLDLPDDLPVPVDDGAAQHLPGMKLPAMTLTTTSGDALDVSTLAGCSIIYVYPRTGLPDQPLPEGWDFIPGARGCTPQSCAFRDHHADLQRLGVSHLFGLSTQSSAYQREARERLHLPFELLSDSGFRLGDALNLPDFETSAMRLYKRLTLVLRDARIRHVFYPVFPPDQSAQQVLSWLETNGS